jgi:hypothetical protein
MKHTIKIDPLRALVIQPEGQQVTIAVLTAGVTMFRQTVSADQAAILAQAFDLSAQQAAHRVGAAP